MAKGKSGKADTGAGGEQLDLIDIHPKEAKPIIAAARLYKKYQLARMAAGKKEVEQKRKVLELVKEAKLQPLEGGKIKFEYNGVEISIMPRDELVKIKDKTEEE